MTKERFRDFNFRQKTLDRITEANEIIEEYEAQGFTLTIRQLYYQFVARDWIENSQRSYKNLVNVMGKARLAGLTDWDAIEDRTRNLKSNAHWTSPASVIQSAYSSFRIDKWEHQPNRVEVWIEKEALAGVIESICQDLDVAYFSCRGYVSLSEMYVAAKRLEMYNTGYEQAVYILHLGDHDPSGIDMTRDIDDRAWTLTESPITIDRLALNWDQIETYNPPPNFAKVTDSRAKSYIQKYGAESWELDALEPQGLRGIIEKAVLDLRDKDTWQQAVDDEKEMRVELQKAAANWPSVVKFLNGGQDD